MDRFDEEIDEMEEKNVDVGAIALFFINLIAIVFIGLVLYWAYNEFVYTDEIVTNIDGVTTNGTIYDIYKSTDINGGINRYYISIKTKIYGNYDIEINKDEFITYKIGDVIVISIKNNTATIINKDSLGLNPRDHFILF